MVHVLERVCQYLANYRTNIMLSAVFFQDESLDVVGWPRPFALGAFPGALSKESRRVGAPETADQRPLDPCVGRGLAFNDACRPERATGPGGGG